MDNFKLHAGKPFLFKEKLAQQLSLSQSLHQSFVEKRFWFCSMDIGEWEEVEIFIEGDGEGPGESFIKIAEQISVQWPGHVDTALGYLQTFMPAQHLDGYHLSSILIGTISTINEVAVCGFSLSFVYGDYPDAFQFKVKYKKDGWPIGFEGGPL
ncbi:hypothetical protein [Domibacillus robiginosus]|uniref:hypothetical protein n=1 Tax=Domibacillus robiginosus TaxID=1071054 RepID=UPI00067CCA88|nr:hypothetical protein [Domibacillus robiginosus]